MKKRFLAFLMVTFLLCGCTSYEVPLEREKEQPNVNRAIIQQYFPEFDKTPGIFYANGGKCIDSIHQSQRMTEELFDNWVKKHKLDKKVN